MGSHPMEAAIFLLSKCIFSSLAQEDAKKHWLHLSGHISSNRKVGAIYFESTLCIKLYGHVHPQF